MEKWEIFRSLFLACSGLRFCLSNQSTSRPTHHQASFLQTAVWKVVGEVGPAAIVTGERVFYTVMMQDFVS